MLRSIVPPFARSARSRRLFTALVWAVVSLLCVHQTMGLLHAVVHGHGHAHEHTHADPVQPQTLHQDHDGDGVFVQLFSSHEDDSPDCRLFDQSSHGDAMAGLPPVVLPLAVAPFVFSVLAGLAVARWHALFQARGPPRIR